MPQQPDKLRRTLSLPAITFYGVGTIVGAGIYVLVGKVAGLAGNGVVYAFLVAGLVATFTAFSYCELVSRFPRAAGEALYVQKGFGIPALSRFVGWLVVLTGMISAATIANGFTGYLAVFIDVPETVSIAMLVLGLGLLAAWGIKQSAILVNTVAIISILGLIYVAYAGSGVENPQSMAPIWALPNVSGISGVFLAAFLAFYAFIGFEDMVNLVEEVKEPRRTLPLAILIAIVLSVSLYVLVAAAAAYALPIEELAGSDAPLADIVIAAGFSPGPIAVVSMIAVVNGALVQLIMASRVLYGMADQGLTLKFLGKVNSRTQTPVLATGLVTMAILLFALWLPLTTLAKATSFVVLGVFLLVNLGLYRLKSQDKNRNMNASVSFSVPRVVPVLGALSCLMLMMVQLFA